SSCRASSITTASSTARTSSSSPPASAPIATTRTSSSRAISTATASSTAGISPSWRFISGNGPSRSRHRPQPPRAAAGSGGREAAEAGDLAAGGGTRGIEGGKLLLRGLAIWRLRELVDQPLIGLDRCLIVVELLERQRQLVEGHVLGQRRIRLVEHLPQLLRHLLSLALAALELQQIEARLDGQHVVAVLLGEVAPQLPGRRHLAGGGVEVRQVQRGHVSGIGPAVIGVHPLEQLAGACLAGRIAGAT